MVNPATEFRKFRLVVTLGLCASLLALAAAQTNTSQSAAATSMPVTPQALMSKLTWRSIGPYIGGRVVAVTGVRGNANLFYAGTVGGGIWKSTDEGIRWDNISDGTLPGTSSSIGAIAVAPSNPNVLYAGTGETDIRNTVIPGDGIYKSTDAGKTWQYAGLRDTHSIGVILIDPANPDIVYAASMGHVFKPNPERGIFKTTDGGRTWNKILFVDDNTGAIALVMDPLHPTVLYAAMWQAIRTPWGLTSGGPGSGIYKSDDAGAHWANISRNPGLPGAQAGTILGRVGLAVAASDPNIVYAIVEAEHGGVFRSDDAGANWTRVNREWKLRQRAFYYMTIYADPKDPNTVYAPQVDALWVSHDGAKTFTKLRTPHGDNHALWINPDDTRILLEGNDGGATVSTDDGNTWSSVKNQPTGQFYHVNLDDQFPFHVYGAQQDEGSYEGPSASIDGRIGISEWHSVAYGESTYTVAQPGDPNITYGSGYYSIFLRYDRVTGDYRSVSPWPYYQDGAASNELKYRFGWTHPILFSPADPKEMLIAAQVVFESDDYGQTWRIISPDLTRNQPATEVPSGGPIDIDQSGAEVYPLVSALAVSPLDGNLIWAGSDDGLAHITTDGGKSWRDVTPPGLPESWISCIEPSHTDKNTAYLTARRYMWDDSHPYVFETNDLGRHWTPIIAGLPSDEYVFDLRQDPNDPKLLFLGTSSTVYISLDAGANWQPLTLNLPVAQVRDIAINERQGDVVIATHGRAFWILDNLTLLEQLTAAPAVSSEAPYLFTPQPAWLSHSYGVPSSKHAQAGYGVNPPFGATIFFQVPRDYDGNTPATLAIKDDRGNVIRSFELHLKKQQPPTAKPPGSKTKPAQARSAAAEQEADHSGESSDQQIREAEQKLTAIEPGMNRLQWDLRYPYATEVVGYHAPIAAGGLDDSVAGPLVVPGRYSVVLDYGGRQTEQSLVVALDPRLNASPQDLEARLALGLRIHADLDAFDKDVNRALSSRTALQNAVAAGRLSSAQASPALASLNREIDASVQMKIQSSEGDVEFEPRMREHLAYLAAEVDLGYARPTPAQYAVFNMLHGEYLARDRALRGAIATATRLAP
jgi:photosystem II stability/assembly factor-like uncharacterized protein